MRCSGARVLRTPSHVKESFTAAIVVRSLWAAERSSWVVGEFVLVGWVVDRLVVCWPVLWDVVVAVDIGTCDLLECWMKGPAAKTADRLVATQAWKSPWLVTVLERWEARSATEATMEPPATVSPNQRSEIPDDGLGRCRDAAQPPDPIDRREENRIKIYRRDRTGSALAPMEVDTSADVGRHRCGGW